jgi:hypothetical protein
VRACARDRGVGGSDRAAFMRTICGDQAKPQNTPTTKKPVEQERKARNSLTNCRPGAWRTPTGTRYRNTPP